MRKRTFLFYYCWCSSRWSSINVIVLCRAHTWSLISVKTKFIKSDLLIFHTLWNNYVCRADQAFCPVHLIILEMRRNCAVRFGQSVLCFVGHWKVCVTDTSNKNGTSQKNWKGGGQSAVLSVGDTVNEVCSLKFKAFNCLIWCKRCTYVVFSWKKKGRTEHWKKLFFSSCFLKQFGRPLN